MDDEARSLARDGFASGMAAEQSRRGLMPTPAENARLADPYLEQLEQQMAEERPAPAPQVAERPKRGAAEIAAERGFTLLRDDDLPADAPGPTLDDRTAVYAERLWARVGLLLTRVETGPRGEPSWRDRVLAAVGAWQVNRRWGVQDLVAVCDESERLWGSWRTAPTPRVFVGGGL